MEQKNKDNLIQPETSNSYKIIISNFEGPLDLLLHLIKGSKLDIVDVKLSEITEQYLEYMKDLDALDMERAAEFIEVAATLLEIKSKHLLPKDEELEEELSAEDEEAKLLRRLKEYKMFKDAGTDLSDVENVDRFYKEPDDKANDFRVVLKQMSMDNLIKAFTSLMHKIDEKEAIKVPKTIEKDRWTVEEKIFEVKTLLVKKSRTSFKKLINEDYSKSEVITIFLALLELLKMQEIKVEQKEGFGEIDIVRNEEKTDEAK